MKATFLRVGVDEGAASDDSVEDESSGIVVDETGNSVDVRAGDGEGD